MPRREHLEELPRPISAIRQEMHQSASSPALHPHSRHSYSSGVCVCVCVCAVRTRVCLRVSIAAVPQGTPPPHKPVGGDEGFPPPPNRHSEAAPPTAPGDSPAGRQGHERRLQRALPVSKSDGNVRCSPHPPTHTHTHTPSLLTGEPSSLLPAPQASCVREIS